MSAPMRMNITGKSSFLNSLLSFLIMCANLCAYKNVFYMIYTQDFAAYPDAL